MTEPIAAKRAVRRIPIWRGWTLNQYSWTSWEASDGAKVAYGMTPLSAIRRLRRWRKVPVTPS